MGPIYCFNLHFFRVLASFLVLIGHMDCLSFELLTHCLCPYFYMLSFSYTFIKALYISLILEFCFTCNFSQCINHLLTLLVVSFTIKICNFYIIIFNVAKSNMTVPTKSENIHVFSLSMLFRGALLLHEYRLNLQIEVR